MNSHGTLVHRPLLVLCQKADRLPLSLLTPTQLLPPTTVLSSRQPSEHPTGRDRHGRLERATSGRRPAGGGATDLDARTSHARLSRTHRRRARPAPGTERGRRRPPDARRVHRAVGRAVLGEAERGERRAAAGANSTHRGQVLLLQQRCARHRSPARRYEAACAPAPPGQRYDRTDEVDGAGIAAGAGLHGGYADRRARASGQRRRCHPRRASTSAAGAGDRAPLAARRPTGVRGGRSVRRGWRCGWAEGRSRYHCAAHAPAPIERPWTFELGPRGGAAADGGASRR
jgi:hypothetical protein